MTPFLFLPTDLSISSDPWFDESEGLTGLLNVGLTGKDESVFVVIDWIGSGICNLEVVKELENSLDLENKEELVNGNEAVNEDEAVNGDDFENDDDLVK